MRIPYDLFFQDIAIVHFYFESPTVFQFSRDPRMTVFDFISQVGGLLGLCIGFSITSAVEILYWCTVRLWSNINRSGGGGKGRKTSDLDSRPVRNYQQ